MIISLKKFPDEYARTQNNLGNAYWNSAEVRDKEANLGKAINTYQKALKIYIEEKYPIMYQTVKSNLEEALSQLQ